MGKKITVIIFLLLIFTLSGISFLKEEKLYSDTENRTLATKPQFTIEKYLSGEFSSKYQDYIKDQFPFRDQFVSLKNYCEIGIGKKEIKDIYLCDDEYLIENHKKENYESERAEKNSEAIISFGNRWAEKIGNEKVSVMVVPNAQTILKDKLPSFAPAYDQSNYIDKINNGLNDGVFVDVSTTLKEHKDETVYYKTDHHWTTYGSYLAYQKWCKDKGLNSYTKEDFDIEKASEEFLGTIHSKLNIKTSYDTIEIYNVKDYNMKVVYDMGSEISDTLLDYSFLDVKDKYSAFMGGNRGLVEITSSKNETVSDKPMENLEKLNKDESVLMIIKDSYANCMVPMTVGMYDRIYVIDLRYFNMKVDTFIEMYGVTDILFLYNVDTLTSDLYVSRIG